MEPRPEGAVQQGTQAPPPQVPVEAVTDRVTQLQDKIDGLGEKFYTFIGVLQQDAPPLPFDEFKHLNRTADGPKTVANGANAAVADGGPVLPVLPSMPMPEPAAPVPTGPTMEVMEGEAANMAALLLNNVKEVDMLIDSLPGINSTKPEQLKRLQELEKQNQHTAQSLRETLSWAEETLVLVQQALAEIYADRLQSMNEQAQLDRGGTLPFWEFGGSAIVSEDRIRLTPALQSRVGWVWNSVAADMDAWEVQMDFEIGGGGSRGADGMALWYVAEPKKEGISMGSAEEYRGMAVYFDTFDNDGQRYDPFDDGRRGEKASCSNLNRETRSKMRVIYRDGVIQVETDDGAGHWVPCITHHESLPKGYYFGLSAATGHLTDNHDVFSFITYNLDPWRRRPPVPPRQQEIEPEPEHVETVQSTEPVKPNPYLPKDPPNPYLPQQQQQQHEQQQQQQQQQPRSQEDTNKLTSKLDQLTFKVEAVNDMRQPADNNDLTQEIKGALREVRVLQDSVNEFRRVVMEELSAVNKLVGDLKGHVSAEQGNTYNNVARLIRELQQHVTSVQTLVENNALQELKSGKEELKSVVEKSGSVAWWIYFCFFQVCFGVAFIMWKKAKDDANKKFL
ncbi:Legumelike lectin family protein [Acanthamoeba castellanii str. Neff]|uniref:Legumelike lectin family protein n=1 Tax=Acanthamoeba castellanii (strain ATCC 30010 / Neff) TaxID=1257118 RepID=L8GDX5_ACACF|nr:Legumelike lectin family protein [Acanthamoeba castellanii str. Neff]ELR10923.1 Legumelike lectin family protein [Acanthamoeba castellanii str. Neff]